MDHLLEIKSYFDLEEIKQIVKRFKETGYVSVSMSKKMDYYFMNNDVADRLFRRCNELLQYFDEDNRLLMDDIIFEFFDGTGYDYEVNFGIYTPQQWSGWRSVNFSMELSKDFDTVPNKEYTLFLTILSKIMSSQHSEIESAKQELEKKKLGKNWSRYPRSRNLNFFKYMQSIEALNPCFTIDFKRKDLQQIEELLYNDSEQYSNLSGLKTEDFYYRKGSILDRIQTRLSYFKEDFGELKDNIEWNSLRSYETTRRWWNGDELILNPNPILLSGQFKIKFKL